MFISCRPSCLQKRRSSLESDELSRVEKGVPKRRGSACAAVFSCFGMEGAFRVLRLRSHTFFSFLALLAANDSPQRPSHDDLSGRYGDNLTAPPPSIAAFTTPRTLRTLLQADELKRPQALRPEEVNLGVTPSQNSQNSLQSSDGAKPKVAARVKVAEEIAESERKYVRSLYFLLHAFVRPLVLACSRAEVKGVSHGSHSVQLPSLSPELAEFFNALENIFTLNSKLLNDVSRAIEHSSRESSPQRVFAPTPHQSPPKASLDSESDTGGRNRNSGNTS